MLVKSDGKKEEAIINQLIDSDEQLKRQHEIFKAEASTYRCEKGKFSDTKAGK